jgi:hypothetical protein
MTDNAELLKRLDGAKFHYIGNLCTEAAAAIRALEEKVRELEAMGNLLDDVHKHGIGFYKVFSERRGRVGIKRIKPDELALETPHSTE